jgi:hypothetical protein
MAGEHESTTCALGPDNQPCQLCAWANESERREQEREAQPTTTLSPVEQRILAGIQQDQTCASVTVVRAALDDVIDAGYQCSKGCDLRHSWTFRTEAFIGDAQPTDEELELRMKFTDAVVERIAELQAPPHEMDARLLEDLTRARRVLRRGRGSGEGTDD